MSTQPAKPLRRQSARTNVRQIVPGIMSMSLMNGICDICKRHRSQGNHPTCSSQRQARYRRLWEAQA
jgi:hypothetical protein